MLPLNTKNKLNSKALTYLLYQTTMGFLFFGVFIALFVFVGFAALHSYLLMISSAFLILLILGYVYTYFWWSIFDYTVSAENVVVHSGVLVQDTKSVNFNDLQSVNAVSGPVLWMLGLRKVTGYTSSPEQIVISRSKNGTEVSHRPDVELVVEKQIAEEFLSLAQKGDVQAVRNVVSDSVIPRT